MRLNDLIEQLEDIRNMFDEDIDPEIRIATQPNYPIQSTVYGVVSSLDIDDGEDLDGDNPVVWVVERNQCNDPYASQRLWDNF
jgi:hypothetical protein